MCPKPTFAPKNMTRRDVAKSTAVSISRSFVIFHPSCPTTLFKDTVFHQIGLKSRAPLNTRHVAAYITCLVPTIEHRLTVLEKIKMQKSALQGVSIPSKATRADTQQLMQLPGGLQTIAHVSARQQLQSCFDRWPVKKQPWPLDFDDHSLLENISWLEFKCAFDWLIVPGLVLIDDTI